VASTHSVPASGIEAPGVVVARGSAVVAPGADVAVGPQAASSNNVANR